MRHRLPILSRTGLVLAVVLTLFTAQLGAQPSTPTATELIHQAAQNLAHQPALEAKLRQTVTLFGQSLRGSGSYRQLIVGDNKMFRLEMKLAVADTTTSLLQVCDGTTLWEKRDLGTSQQQGYLMIRPFRELVQQEGLVESGLVWMAVGGLDQLLRGLNQSFQFEAPIPRSVGTAKLPVWELRGHWKAEMITRFLPEGSTPSGDWDRLPEHLPHRVVLTLGRDQQLPLFPYRIEYLRQLPEPVEQTAVVSEPQHRRLASIQLYEVQRYANMDPQHFVFQIDKQTPVEDMSERYLAWLQARRGQGGRGDE